MKHRKMKAVIVLYYVLSFAAVLSLYNWPYILATSDWGSIGAVIAMLSPWFLCIPAWVLSERENYFSATEVLVPLLALFVLYLTHVVLFYFVSNKSMDVEERLVSGASIVSAYLKFFVLRKLRMPLSSSIRILILMNTGCAFLAAQL
jgi:hypothetical protein